MRYLVEECQADLNRRVKNYSIEGHDALAPPLHAAVTSGNLSLFQYIVEKYNVDSSFYCGENTPLHNVINQFVRSRTRTQLSAVW